ncbi:Hpt domain-containing protein [Chitinivibrio alkaliphilus]|uniref:HPt domain-containing protein n=1 Tax=Chitinivibrio alkaliphilus ACht1 TaxID=1313304 RepID=U7D9N3_9BACT|nr:Hpt domain-containing protein [Chitinivibrio alkaliphilus]ERP31797.1 hypothetical protein CALK_1243 [Chitinivibrio alkaliphilus ACht1]
MTLVSDVEEFLQSTDDKLGRIHDLLSQLEHWIAQYPHRDHSCLIEELFREFHNIKSMAAFSGYPEIEEISHSLETLLGLDRTGQISLKEREIDLLCEGVSIMRSILDDEESIATSIKTYLHIVDGYAHTSTAGLITIPLPPDNRKEWVLSRALFRRAPELEKKAAEYYLLMYDMVRDVQEKGLYPHRLIEEIAALCHILHSELETEAVGDLTDAGFSMRLYLLCRTSLHRSILMEALDLTDGMLQKISTPSNI